MSDYLNQADRVLHTLAQFIALTAMLPVSAIMNPDVITLFFRKSYAWLNRTIHYPA